MNLVATLISHPARPQISDQVIAHVEAALGRRVAVTWLQPGVACDIALDEAERTAFEAVAPRLHEGGIDLAIQDQDKRRKSVLIADMDSTMIEQECIDELADMIGVKDRVAAITARAMRGEIAFEPALRERVGLLKGLPLSVIDAVVADRITLRSGGRELVQTMRAHGGYTALVSGGFTMFTSRIALRLGFDENRANTLLTENDALSGLVEEPILGSEAKIIALQEICKMRGISEQDAMAIGDGANDLGMIRLAGSGVAVHAKPKVAAEADFSISHGDLTALLFLQGYTRQDFVA